MTERELTDEQVIMLLKDGIGLGVSTMDIILGSALNLIKRYKAEIERYEKTVGKLAINKNGIVTGTLNGKETEYIQKSVADVFKNMAVNRAIKEFAEKIKTDAEWICDDNYIERALIEYIDNLVKERTEGEE